MLTRKENWPDALDAFLRGREKTRFAYGTWDCCLFVCDAIQTMTGVDIAGEFRSCYSSAEGAYQAIRERTGKRSVLAVVASVTRENGMKECPVSLAQRGDVAVIRRGRDYSLGLIDLTGKSIAVAKSSGLARIPLSFALTAFHV